MVEKEWYSTCCTAPPLHDLNDDGEHELLGMCMKCQDKATFELIDAEETTRVRRKETLALFDDIFSAHLGIKTKK